LSASPLTAPPTIAVVCAQAIERTPDAVVGTAVEAERLGYDSVWIGEMATFDAFALATAVGQRTSSIPLVIGPLAVAVRDPVMIAMGVASVTALSGRRVDVAVGSSSEVVVAQWHGRSRADSARRIDESVTALRPLLDGAAVNGYRLRLPAPGSTITVAAFGPGALAVAAHRADRLVLNLVTAEATRRLAADLAHAAADAGRPVPRVAAWIPAAVDPTPDALVDLKRALVGYLAAPGYRDMLAAAGFEPLVRLAQDRPHPRELLAAIPDELPAVIGLVGDQATVAARLGEYRAAGVDDVCLVTGYGSDEEGRRTLAALRPDPPALRSS
jgi:probable F420-dependent oxidoreductase